MLRQLVRDSAVYGLSRVLVQGLSFLMVPLYTRVLTPVDFGALDVLTVCAAIAAVVVALEVSQGMARFFADSTTEEEKAVYASTSLWFALAAYSIFALVAIVFARGISRALLDTAAFERVVQVAVLSAWSNGLLMLVLNQLRADLKAALYGITSFTYALVTLATTVVLVLLLRLGITGFFLAQLLGNCVGLALAVHFSRKRFRLAFDWARLQEMLAFSLPLVPSSIGVLVTLYVDRFAIKEFMTLADVGVFGVGYRLAAVLGLVVGSFQRALTPLIYTHYRNPDTPAQLARIFRYFMVLALLMVLGVGLFAGEIMRVFAAPEYQAAAQVVPLLAAAVVVSNMYIFAPGLDIAKRTGVIALINVGGAGLTAGLNYLLVPLWGLQGAAFATCLSATAVFSAYMTFSQRLYRVPHVWLPLGAAVSAAVAVFLLALTVAPRAGWLSVGLRLALLAGAFVLFVALGLLPRTDLRRGWVGARGRLPV